MKQERKKCWKTTNSLQASPANQPGLTLSIPAGEELEEVPGTAHSPADTRIFRKGETQSYIVKRRDLEHNATPI